MRVIHKSESLLTLRDLNDELKCEIKNKKFPLLDNTEALYFVATNGNLYIIETEQDIEEIIGWIAEERIEGDWKMVSANPSQTEASSLIPVIQNDLPTLTQKEVIINILKIALPITGAVALTVTTNYVTSIFLGNYNTQLLASMTIIEALESPLSTICQFTLYPISPLIGHYKDLAPKRVGKIMQQGYLVSLSASIPSLFIRYFSKPILLALKQSPLLVGHAESYFRASMWGFPATILISADEQLLLATDKKLLYVIMSVSDLAVTLGLGYVLMYGKLGFPETGIASLGYVTAARSWLSFIVYKLYFILHKDFKPYQLFNLSLDNIFSELTTFLKIALPVTLQITSKSSFMFITNMLLGSRYGLSSLIALQVVFRYLPIASLPIQALALATSIQVGINFGQRNFSSISRYGNTGVLLGLCHTALLFGICASLPALLAQPFFNVNDPQYAKAADLLRPFFMILIGGQILEAIDIISVAALRGLMDTAMSMLIGIVSTWLVAFPLVFVMVNRYDVTATLLALISGLVVSSVINWGRWHIFSAPDELEQSIHSRQSENTQTNDSVLSNCFGFFKPARYHAVQIKEARPELSDNEVVKLDDEEVIIEFNDAEFSEEVFDISEEEQNRCRCTVF